MLTRPSLIFQPQYPAGIDWGHPLADGLVAFVIGNCPVPVDLVSQRVGTPSGTPSVRQFQDGTALNIGTGGVSQYVFPYGAEYSNLIGARTAWFSGQLTTTGVQAIFGVNADTPASLSGTPMFLYTGSAGTQVGFILSDGAGSYSWWRSGVNFSTTRPTSYVVSQVANGTTTPKFWVDGALLDGVSDGSGVATPNVTTDSRLRIGNRGAGTRQMFGYFSGGALWGGRNFLPDELDAFGQSPWQVVRQSYWLSRLASRYAAGGSVYAASGRIAGGAILIARGTANRTVSVPVRSGATVAGGVAMTRTTSGMSAGASGAAGRVVATRRATGTVGTSTGVTTGARLARAGAGRIATGVSVQGSGSKVSGAAAAGLVALGVALQGGATARRGAAGAAAAAVAGRGGAMAARSASGRVVAGQAARSGFQVRRAMAGIMAQATGYAAQVAARRVLQGLIADGIILLVQARIATPGNGLRSLTVLLDRRRLSNVRSTSVQVAAADARNLTVARDTRRLPARKDD